MESGLSLLAAVVAVILVMITGVIEHAHGPWDNAAPVLAAACIAAIVAGWAAGRRAMVKLLGRLQALLPKDAPPMGSHADQLLKRLGQQLGAAREDRSRAMDLLARLPAPCMTVVCSGEMTWRNESMARLMGGAGQAEMAAFCARTSAKTWDNLRAGNYDGPFLRVAGPGGGDSLFRADRVEIPGPGGCQLWLFQDMTGPGREAERFAAACESVRQANARIAAGTQALEALALDVNQALAKLAGSMHDSKDQAGQVAQAMQEMTDNVRMMATMAAETARTAARAETLARDGAGAIKETAEVTRKVAASYDHLQHILDQLMHRAGNVGCVVGIISDIADQTNLLALNAAIEAARAGVTGRGFAVVADEVRKLAEKTIQATREVHEAVFAIEECSRQAVGAMAATGEDIAASCGLVASVEDSFTAIAEALVLAAHGIDDIARRAERQCASSFEINMCAMNVTDNSQEVYDEVQNASRELHRLLEQASRLRGMAGAPQTDEKRRPVPEIRRVERLCPSSHI
jgi:methyl-accepting chemotaxis protein